MGQKRFRELRVTAQQDGVARVSFLNAATEKELWGPSPPAQDYLVYRREFPDFVWARHFLEFFDGITWSEADVVHRGRLPDPHVRRGVFVDRDVAVGRTYAYAVGGPDEALPTGPAAVRVYDSRVWWPQAETERRLDALAAAYPGLVEVRTFGRTVLGRPLRGLVAGNRGRMVAAVGTFHAGESGPELLVPVMERLLAEDRALLERVGVAILPSTNVDSREKMIAGYPSYIRTNVRGVDLNRNLPAAWQEVAIGYGLRSDDPESGTYRGTAPASEPETQAVMDFLQAVRPALVLSYHWMACLCGTGVLASSEHCNDAYRAAVRRMSDTFAAGFHGDATRDADLRIADVPGSLELWCREVLGAVGLCMEWPDERYAMDDNVRSKRGETTLEMLEIYRGRHAGAWRAVMEGLARE